MVSLELSLGGEPQKVELSRLIIAGWAGRDQAALQAHIHELEELGVPPPASTPVFYRLSAARVTPSPSIEVLGADSSGEVEAVLLRWKGELWVGVGSDHTDRKAEAVGIALSKQMCDKPIGADFWRYAEVRGHWDRLALRSSRHADGEDAVYQDGSVSELLAPEELIDRLGEDLEEGAMMFCGTVAAIGGIRPAEALEVELSDPVLGRSIRHRYQAVQLPVVA